MKPNSEIRKLLYNARIKGVFSYEVAYAAGVNEVTFSRWLRRELPDERREQVKNIIDNLIKEKAGCQG